MKIGVFSFLRAIFFAPRCIACRISLREGMLCGICLKNIHIARTLFCGACHARLFGDKVLCHPRFPYILGAAARYEDNAVRSLVHALKFGRMQSAARPLADLLIEYASSQGTLLDGMLVIPIPLSARRLRTRGFNQAELIARPFAEARGLEVHTEVLVRARHTKPQSEIETPAERRENIRGSFAVRNAAAICGRDILILDDVTTTGATLYEAAGVLTDAGAARIVGLAVGKA
jgi:ComF family protein